MSYDPGDTFKHMNLDQGLMYWKNLGKYEENQILDLFNQNGISNICCIINRIIIFEKRVVTIMLNSLLCHVSD